MTQLEKNEERYLSTQEIADLLSCKVATVRRWASAGGVEGVDFPEVAVVVGGVRGWERSAVLKFGTEVARIRRRRRDSLTAATMGVAGEDFRPINILQVRLP